MNISDQPFEESSSCPLCCYPEWTVDESRAGEYEIGLESYTVAQTSAYAGCHGCFILLQVWNYTVPDSIIRSASEFRFNKCSENLWIHIFGVSGKDKGVADIELFTLPNEPSFKHIKVASQLWPSTHLQHTLTQIQTWIKECNRSHPKCNIYAAYSPDRLLDTMNSNLSVVNLVEPPSTAAAPQYACLSHCWGKTRSKHTTRASNLQKNFVGIPISELPRTFQDAIEVTRALNIRYLWIDSLCIIQDSESDWKKHVAEMAQIYENADITLAAGASSDDDGGFFVDIPEEWANPHRFTLDIDGTEYNFHIRRSVDHPDAYWPAREVLPIMERGWCFQERMLSRKYLCFGSKEVLWECKEEVACSCSMATGFFNPQQRSDWPGFPGCIPTKWQMAQLGGLQSLDSAATWRTLVTEFSTRKLTFPSDKLPALAGLANTFQNKGSVGTYLVGLWSHSIKRDIAWRYYGNAAPPGRPRKGPSWSWVSAADGEIEWPSILFHPSYQVRPVVSLNEGSQPYAHSLEVSGILLPVSIQTWELRDADEEVIPLTRHVIVTEWRRRHSEPELQVIRCSGRLVQTIEGNVDMTNAREQPKTMEDSDPKSCTGHFNADYKFWTSEKGLQDELQHATIFLVGNESYFREPKSWGEDTCWAHGIVLKSVDRQGPIQDTMCQYERIGWLRYYTLESPKDWFPPGFRSKFLLL